MHKSLRSSQNQGGIRGPGTPTGAASLTSPCVALTCVHTTTPDVRTGGYAALPARKTLPALVRKESAELIGYDPMTASFARS